MEIAMAVLHEGEISGVPEIMSASINTWESLDGVCSGGMDNLVWKLCQSVKNNFSD